MQHATLNSQDRGWGPARHTELTGSQLRRTTGGGRGGRGEGGGEGGEVTDIKSNNPHLTGGAKKDTPPKTKLEGQFFGGFLVECFSFSKDICLGSSR